MLRVDQKLLYYFLENFKNSSQPQELCSHTHIRTIISTEYLLKLVQQKDQTNNKPINKWRMLTITNCNKPKVWAGDVAKDDFNGRPLP